MRLSRLQAYILQTCISRGGKSGREPFIEFYKALKMPPSHDDQVNAITKAIERLIDRELMVGYGMRTPHKWYIKEARLTPKGRREAKELFGKQQPLPLKKLQPTT